VSPSCHPQIDGRPRPRLVGTGPRPAWSLKTAHFTFPSGPTRASDAVRGPPHQNYAAIGLRAYGSRRFVRLQELRHEESSLLHCKRPVTPAMVTTAGLQRKPLSQKGYQEIFRMRGSGYAKPPQPSGTNESTPRTNRSCSRATCATSSYAPGRAFLKSPYSPPQRSMPHRCGASVSHRNPNFGPYHPNQASRRKSKRP